MENNTQNTMRNFFRYMGIGELILCIKVDTHLAMIEMLKELFLFNVYCLSGAVFFGISGMFSNDLYLYIKKNFITHSNNYYAAHF